MEEHIKRIKSVIVILAAVSCLLISGNGMLQAKAESLLAPQALESRAESIEVSTVQELTNRINKDAEPRAASVTHSLYFEGGEALPNPITNDFYFFLNPFHDMVNCPSSYFRVGAGGRLAFNGGTIKNGGGICIVVEDGGKVYLCSFREIDKVPSEENPDIDICTFRASASRNSVLYVADADNSIMYGDILNQDEVLKANGKFYTAGADETIIYYSEDWIVGEDNGTGELKLYRGDLSLHPPVNLARTLDAGLDKLWIGPECKVSPDANGVYKLEKEAWWNGMSSITFAAGANRGDLKIVNTTTIPVALEDEQQKLYVGFQGEVKTGMSVFSEDSIQIDGKDYYRTGTKGSIKPEDGYTVFHVYAQKAGDALAPKIPAVIGTDRCSSITVPNYSTDFFYKLELLTGAGENIQYSIKQKDSGSTWKDLPEYDPNISYLSELLYVVPQSGYQVYRLGGEAISDELELAENGALVTCEFFIIVSDASNPDYGKEYQGTYTYSLDNTAPVINSVTLNPESDGFLNEDIEVSVDAEDAIVGLADQAYSFDGGSTWQKENTRIYSETAHLKGGDIQVRDALFHITKYDSDLDIKIDKIRPVLQDDKGNAIDGSNYATSLTGQVVEDNLVSLFLYEGPSAVGTPTELALDSNQTFTVEAKERDCQYTLEAEDAAGNKSQATFSINGFESDLEVSMEKPINITYGDTIYDGIDDFVRLKLENTADLSIKVNAIELDEEGASCFALAEADTVGSILKGSVDTTVKIRLLERQKPGLHKGVLTVKYTNSRGRDTYETLNLEASVEKRPITVSDFVVTKTKKYDKTVSVAVAVNGVQNVLTDDDIVVTASGVYETPDVGVNKKITVTFHASGAAADCYTVPADVFFTDGEVQKVQGTGEFHVSNCYEGEKISIEKAVSDTNGTPKIYYKKANASDSDYLESILYSPENTGNYSAMAVFAPNNNYDGFKLYSNFTIFRLEPPSDLFRLSGTKGDNGWYTSDVTVVPKEGFYIVPGKDMEVAKSLTYTKTMGASQLDFERAGGAKVGPISLGEIKIDKTGPICGEEEGIQIKTGLWRKLLEGVTFLQYENKSVKVTIKGHDPESGIAKISYMVSPKALSRSEVVSSNDFQQGDTFTLDPKEDGSWVVYAKIVNKAGLVTYLSSDGMMIDQNAPVISGIRDGERSQADNVEIKVTDYSIDRVMLNGVAQKLDGTGAVLLLKAQAQDTDYTLEAYDKCGNSSTIRFTICKKKESNDTEQKETPNDTEEKETPNGSENKETPNDSEQKEIPDNSKQQEVIISKAGKMWLDSGVLYTFSKGYWCVQGDQTVYYGGQSFMIGVSGEYKILKQKEVNSDNVTKRIITSR